MSKKGGHELNKFRKVSLLILCVVFAVSISSVEASPTTFNFTGTISGVASDDLGLGVSVGTPITGSYTFDSAAADSNPSPGTASYQMTGSPYGFTALILGQVFGTADFLAVNVVNNNPDDEYGVLGCAGGLVGCSESGATYVVFNWLLTDSSNAAFSSPALPVTPPSLGGFQTNFFELDVLTEAGAFESVQGSITSLVRAPTAAVPEPATLLLVSAGIAVAGLARRLRCPRRVSRATTTLTFERRHAAMWLTKARTLVAMVTAFAMFGGLGAVAHAVDGTFLISQNLVNASGGFPYTINQPGSYRLSSNLTVPDQNTNAINITADNVTLDLNGFSIIGPVVCTGAPPTCSPANASGIGVNASGRTNVTVMNGTVRGMGLSAVRVGFNGAIRSVRVLSTGGAQFSVAIFMSDGSVASDNNLKDIAGEGIFGDSGNTISKNVVTNLAPFGSCINTTGAGGVGGTIEGNTCHDVYGGIEVGAGYLVIGNSVTNATHSGMGLQSSSGYANNVLNNPNAFFGNVSGGVNLGHNVCGNALCP